MARRNRTRKVARRPPSKNAKPLILVVTEGEVTEPEYLNGFARSSRNPRVTIVIERGAGVPKTVVQRANELKEEARTRANREGDENLIYDEVWCIFDIDVHPHVPEARQLAEAYEISLAISNPCIELWLYLHFAEQPGMQDRNKMRLLLTKHVPDYDKHVRYANYEQGYDSAVSRASRLDKDAEADGEPGRNPTSGMYQLTERIRAGS